MNFPSILFELAISYLSSGVAFSNKCTTVSGSFTCTFPKPEAAFSNTSVDICCEKASIGADTITVGLESSYTTYLTSSVETNVKLAVAVTAKDVKGFSSFADIVPKVVVVLR